MSTEAQARSRLSPLNRRRLEIFKSNRRGYYSLCLFSVLFAISLCAELIANDAPIVFSYKGELHFPILFFYSEAELGGVLETEAEYRDPFVADLIDADGWALW
ncbi:TPA: ABC transporter permease, partial [Candidatus Latescibacteria bacterium]|nr:ABC transporter permease [Candidatus Latescibacterota bacterium]